MPIVSPRPFFPFLLPVLPVLPAFLLLATGAAQAVTLGQADDFESETTEGWQAGQIVVPVQTTGGPAGVGDAYLRPAATGTPGAGSRLALYNEAQWAGDFTAAGVGAVELDVRHFSGSDVYLRVALSGPSGSVTSAAPILVSPPAAWETIVLSLDPGDLVFLDGSGDVDSVLADTVHFRLLHAENLPTIGLGGLPRGEQLAAVIGIDNVTALPEPGAGIRSAVALLAGLALRARRRGLRG